jgi:hypothetical protein
MKEIVTLIFEGKLTEAKERLEEFINQKIEAKLFEKRLDIIHEMYDGLDCDLNIEELDEGKNVQRSGRVKVVRVRVRGGKVQARKKFSAVKGYTIRGGKMVRMSSQEQQKRKLGARKAKFKRRAKLQQALRKRQRSISKRKAMGI